MSPVPGQSVPQPDCTPLHPRVGAAPSPDLLYLQSEPGQCVFLYGSLCPKTKPQRTSWVSPQALSPSARGTSHQCPTVRQARGLGGGHERCTPASQAPVAPYSGTAAPLRSGPSPGGFSRAGPSDHGVRVFSSVLSPQQYPGPATLEGVSLGSSSRQFLRQAPDSPAH
ncbi:hypothetical protein NDU88_009297 [Pleurodeles waltl]|uniref:Uncharacterized protein n=1 Tax=Pleurodeles waltl TaxID=8319 RepID=A0AAV7QX65_PLEWA|nr:hypothetical protein NDU88_009297 [Pleurodeles waltl]